MAAVALHDIADGEELFMNYRFNPLAPTPDWYTDPDPEAAARRWGQVNLL
jgi:hypothetical protein